MISVIIPHHREGLDLMNGCLSSLDSQRGIDFEKDIEIIIVNDDKDFIIRDFSAYRNIKPHIRQYLNEKKGYMGVSRQIGINNSRGEYLMFIDADDMLAAPMVICDAISRLTSSPDTDVFCYKFFEEAILPTGSYAYLEHDNDFVWMFAKVYKKAFLTQNRITFHNDILWHEDTYFNQLLLSFSPRVEIIPSRVYIWACTKDSITRKNNGEYTYSSLHMYIEAIDKVLEKIKMRITGGQVLEKVSWLTAYMYCLLQRQEAPEIREKFRPRIESALRQFISRWDTDKAILSEDSLAVATRTIMEHSKEQLLPNEGFVQFVKRICGI